MRIRVKIHPKDLACKYNFGASLCTFRILDRFLGRKQPLQIMNIMTTSALVCPRGTGDKQGHPIITQKISMIQGACTWPLYIKDACNYLYKKSWKTETLGQSRPFVQVQLN